MSCLCPPCGAEHGAVAAPSATIVPHGGIGQGVTVRREDFTTLPEEVWTPLLAESATNAVFLTHAWQRIWWEHFGAGKELLLLSVWSHDGRLVGIVPLAQEGETVLFGGGFDVSDYLDLIARPEDVPYVWTQVLRYLQDLGWSALDLRCIPAASPSLEALREIAVVMGYQASVVGQDVCPILELPESWDAFLSKLSKKDRHELRRKLRRLEGAGQVRMYAVAGDADAEALAQDMSDFFHLHKISREEKAVFMTPEMEDFFRAVAAHFVPLGEQRTFFLELDGVRVASCICFDYGQGRYLYNSGYDHAYANLSVGLLLKALCIEDAIIARKNVFDFLRGDEPYKYDLGGHDVPIFRCVVQQ